MMSFGQFLSEIYNEPDDSTFSDNGHEYDLNGILSATLGMETRQFSVDRLKWVLEWDDPYKDPARVAAADLNAPILVIREGAMLVVIDGLHRLAKAVKEGVAEIKGILVPDEIEDRYRL